MFLELGGADHVPDAALAQIGIALLGRELRPVEHAHGDDAVVFAQRDAAHARGRAAHEFPHILRREAQRLALPGRQQDMVARPAGLHAHQHVVLVELHRDLAAPGNIDEIRQRVAPHIAVPGREHDRQVLPAFLVVRHRHDGGDALARRQCLDDLLHLHAAPLRAGARQPVDLELVNDARGREEQQRRVRVRDDDLRDRVLVAGGHARPALAAALLRPVGGKLHAPDIAALAHRHDHVLALDQVFLVGVDLVVGEDRTALVRKAVPHALELLADHRQQLLPRTQDFQIAPDALRHLFQFFGDLLPLEAGKPVQAQVQDRARLRVAQPVAAVLQRAAGRAEKRQQRRRVGGRPGPRQQGGARFGGIARLPDDADDLVDIGDGDREADQHMRALPGLAEVVAGAPRDDLLAKGDEGADDTVQGQRLGPSAVQRQHIDAEAHLHLCVPVELVQQHAVFDARLELDDDADAAPVALVPERLDALDQLQVHDLADALDHPRLVDLVGHLRDDDRLAVALALLDLGAGPEDDRAPAGHVGLPDAVASQQYAARREVRPRHIVHQLVDGDRRVVEKSEAGVDHLAQIVGRDVGRHADGDAARAVYEQVRILRRQDGRFLFAVVVVRLEIDRILVDVGQQRLGRPREPRFRVAHRRRGVVVHRAEIALARDQRQAHGEGLRHPHHGVVDRAVAMRMELAHYVADDARRLAEGLVPAVAAFAHGVEDAPVHRLQPVAHIRQRARHDHAHRVIEI